MDDVGLEPAKETPQLQKGQNVLADGDRPGRVPQGHVADAPCFELGDERSGSRYADHLHAGVGKGSELWTEEQHQAHVHGGDMNQPLPDERAHRVFATCS